MVYHRPTPQMVHRMPRPNAFRSHHFGAAAPPPPQPRLHQVEITIHKGTQLVRPPPNQPSGYADKAVQVKRSLQRYDERMRAKMQTSNATLQSIRSSILDEEVSQKIQSSSIDETSEATLVNESVRVEVMGRARSVGGIAAAAERQTKRVPRSATDVFKL